MAANAYSYDDNGNLTDDGGTTYTHDPENRLISTVSTNGGANNATLRYDPFGRLYEVTD